MVEVPQIPGELTAEATSSTSMESSDITVTPTLGPALEITPIESAADSAPEAPARDSLLEKKEEAIMPEQQSPPPAVVPAPVASGGDLPPQDQPANAGE